MKTARLIVFLGIIVMLVACGKKGPVRPLEANLPDTVQNVELQQSGNELLLSWQPPTHNQNHTQLKSVPSVDIYRALFDPTDDCPECKDRSTLLHSIDPELPQPARLSGGRYLLRDRQVTVGQGYRYRLVPRNRLGQDGRPLMVQMVVTEPPAAPVGLMVEAHDRSTTLRWQPRQPAEGRELLGYRIYRSQDGGSQLAELLNQRPLTTLEYDDTNLENGLNYSYQLRVLFNQNGQILESLPSDTASARPQAGL